MPQKLIIDTDSGVDDAMAIYLALRSPELDLVGLTTIFGNVNTDLATTNALRLLEIANRSDICVAKGADHPLTGLFKGPAPRAHGDDGQGNTNLPPPTTQAIKKPAAQFIIEKVMATPGEITIVAIGPLTNIALALHLEPNITRNVKEVVLMGGNALCYGNATPAAEANIYHDPEAANTVFGANWMVTIVGLDVTRQVNMTPEYLAQYQQAHNPLAQHIAKIVPFYQRYAENRFGIRGIYVHDSSAIAHLIDPTLFEVERWPLCVETQGISRGKTWPYIGRNEDMPLAWQNRPPVNVCLQVDSARLLTMAVARLTQPHF